MRICLSIFSALIFSQSVFAVDFDLRIVNLDRTDKFIRVFRPHTIIDDVTYRFNANKKTYEGLCHLILDGIRLVEVEDGFKSSGNVLLSSDGDLISRGPITRSFKFIKCFFN